MLPREYFALDLNGGKAYVKKDRLNQLRRVEGVVFDCDGVLIDIRGSYNRAISKAVAFILEGLTGYAVPESLISDEVIFLFRKSGGFNNDWDTVYGILMFMLSCLPENPRGRLKERIEMVGLQPDPFKRLSLTREAAKTGLDSAGLSQEFFECLIDELKEFTKLLDATGTASVDRNLVGSSRDLGAFLDFYNALKHFLHYPAGVGESIVARVFEEFFCGPELFQKTYGVMPRFYTGPGMVENEEVIVRPETIDHLTFVLGKANLGIASGSRFAPANHVLGDLLERFNPEALVFLETMEKTEHEQLGEGGSKVNLKKPHSFSLLKAIEAFGSFNSVLYVGDSMEDALMVQEARNLGKPFLFAGVYRYSGFEDALLRCFLESGCDMVIPSVNELPIVLERLGKEEK